MARQESTGSIRARPSTLSTKSFARYEPSSSSPVRSRAATIQSTKSPRNSSDLLRDDLFEKTEEPEDSPITSDLSRSQSLPEKFDELPIELISLVDRFVDSLSAKTWTEPPTVDDLSELFQDFYIRAFTTISVHVSALRSRLNRDVSPTPSKSSAKSRTIHRTDSKDSLAPTDASRQMLTSTEVTERRRARRLLDYKRVLLEEAVERRVCEKVYSKIWRHKSSLDEVQDEKLRSRTAALALVGIGLKDLGVEIKPGNGKTVEDIQESLGPARARLAQMNEEHSPLGKLQHLTTAHKAIVDTLVSILPSSSSADEILPTLIYTLITSPIEGINIISNLNFIQRFRASTKIDGEAAYCMTNLEAAISFLENVDLASLRADESLEGPGKASVPATPPMEKLDPFPKLATGPLPTAATTLTETTKGVVKEGEKTQMSSLKVSSKPLPSPRHQRTLSDLFQPPAKAIAATNEAVRNTAEEGLKTISNTLDNSFKFLFGRLKEHNTEHADGDVVVPKTLDEARQLVSRPLTPDGDDLGIDISETSSIAEKESGKPSQNSSDQSLKTEERLAPAHIANRRAESIRDRSVDSTRSSGSTKRSMLDKPNPAPTAPITTNPLEQVKNFGNNFNPLNHIPSAFRGFGSRPNPAPVAGNSNNAISAPASVVTVGTTKEKLMPSPAPASNAAKQDDISPVVAPLTLNVSDLAALTSRIVVSPPIRRFMEVSDASELMIGEVQTLLDDYQRLVQVLKEVAVASAEKRNP